MSKKRIVVVAPGRGSYTKENLGYLSARPEITQDLKLIDNLRKELGEPSVSEMDQAKSFKVSLHTKGEHASPLIYTCALADFLSIDQEQYEIVAITGNSMGWYLALAFAKALNAENSFHLIQTMGAMMKNGLVGGQMIYPIVNDDWSMNYKLVSEVTSLVNEVNGLEAHEAYISIYLGGYLVLAGNEKGLSLLSDRLEPKDHYPFKLINHGAFHTPMLHTVSQNAFQILSDEMFNKPQTPLIDGRGHIWQPYSTSTKDLYQYTLGHQVTKTYDFTASITTVLKEFSPDHLVLLGPGNSLGGAIGQIMIKHHWQGIGSKEDFSHLQKKNPFLISMGLKQQKQWLQAQI